MKKIILLLIGCILFLVGCNNDSNYIETVMNIRFENGKTVEKIVNEKAILGEFYVENEGKLEFNKVQYGLDAISMRISPSDLMNRYKQKGVKMPLLKELEWKIEGETNEGKVVTAATDEVIIKIPTVKNKDYIQVNLNNIKVYNLKTNTVITDKELEAADLYYKMLQEYNYKN